MFPNGQETMTQTRTTPRLRAWALAAALLAGTAGAALAEDVTVALSTFALVETTDAQGNTTRERAEIAAVLPGATILFRIELANAGEAVADLTLDVPLPEAMRIDPDSFHSDVAVTVTFALADAPDGFAAFPELVVPTDEGGTRPATPDDLGAARVTIATLATEQTAFVEYEATVR